MKKGRISSSQIDSESPFPLVSRSRAKVLLATIALMSFASFGCQPTATKPGDKGTNSAASHDDHGHDHAHDHGEHGAHGGHMLHLEPTGEHAEWTHDDEAGVLTVYFEEMVSAGSKIEKVRVDLSLGDKPKKAYDLEGTAADDHKIEGSIFSIKSPELVTALGVGEGVKAELIVTVAGKDLKASLEHDHGHDHDHSH